MAIGLFLVLPWYRKILDGPNYSLFELFLRAGHFETIFIKIGAFLPF